MTGDKRPVLAALTAALACTAIAAAVVWNDQPAISVADALRPTLPTNPIVPTRKPVEYSPRLAGTVSGDNASYLIGAEIKRGTYHTEGGSSCYWAVWQGGAIVRSAYRSNTPQDVAFGKDDVSFSTGGCADWVLVP